MIPHAPLFMPYPLFTLMLMLMLLFSCLTRSSRSATTLFHLPFCPSFTPSDQVPFWPLFGLSILRFSSCLSSCPSSCPLFSYFLLFSLIFSYFLLFSLTFSYFLLSSLLLFSLISPFISSVLPPSNSVIIQSTVVWNKQE